MIRLRVISTAIFITALLACGGGDKGTDAVKEVDSLTLKKQDSIAASKVEVNRLKDLIVPYLSKEFSKWAASFQNFSIDSFRFIHKGLFEDSDYEYGYKDFLSLYKPSLIFSADSSYFIDIYSGGIYLERKGKKLTAISDVDQVITIYNTKNKEWKRIAFFGPSASVQEGVWASSTQFILTGTGPNNDGADSPLIMIGNAIDKTIHWFEANNKRLDSTKYEASGMLNLKIDEWE